MSYPTRRARIQAEAAAERSRRSSRRGRSLAAGAAGLATLAGASLAGMAPAAANDSAAPAVGQSQQNTWSYSGESARSSSSTGTSTTASGAGTTRSAGTVATASSGAGVSLGTGIQRASYTTASTATGSNAVAADYAAAKAASSSTYYQWGGNGPYGFDCSGLTQQAFAAAGKSIPRGSAAQFSGASQHVSLDELQVGDLVFWSDNGSASGIYHVAVYIGDGQIAHARNPTSGVSVTAVDYSPWNMLGTAARY